MKSDKTKGKRPRDIKNVELTKRYSGRNSYRFWGMVKSLRGTKDWEACYMMGCMLQDLEDRVLIFINERTCAKIDTNKRKGGR